MKNFQIYDIGKELFSAPSYPGDPVPEKRKFFSVENGDACNLTLLTLGSHNGTHLDAPRHFFSEKYGADKIPLEKTLGMCRVAELSGEISAEEVRGLLEGDVRKLLIKGEILLTQEAAQVMAERKLDLVGVEGQTVGEGETQISVHRILLEAEVVILEGLVLKEVTPGKYFLAAQPLKMEGLDGSPVRPVLLG